jgi:hypothetical protein
MKITKSFECRTDDVSIGFLDGDDWRALETDGGANDEEIAVLLKKKNANEIILRSVIDFTVALREALNADLKELYERSAKE